MKNRIIIITIIIITTTGLITWGILSSRSWQRKYQIAEANNKAWSSKVAGQDSVLVAFRVTVDQLNYFKDSTVDAMRSLQKELGIKDKEIQRLEHLGTTFTKKDTITLRDTLFKEDFHLDTTLGDQWMSTRLTLDWPSSITTATQAISSKTVLVSGHNETIEPARKFFLFRWFQKKHTVVKVDVREANPHITDQDNTFIEIIK